jgi:TonB family protein
MPRAPKFAWSLLAVSLCLVIPVRSQENAGPSAPPPLVPVTYPDTAEGLRRLLQAMLASAAKNDQRALWVLIKDTEIPNYRDWFISAYGREQGQSWAQPYGKELASNEADLQLLLNELAGTEGVLAIRRVNGVEHAGNQMEEAMQELAANTNHPVDIFYADWSASADGNSKNAPIGYFMFIDGKFRWNSNVRVFKVQSVKSSDNPNSPRDGSTQSLDPSASDSESERTVVVDEPGKNGVGYPKCIDCPPAQLSDEARKAKFGGTVELQVVIQADGHPTNIVVVKRLGKGLDEKAVEAVSGWRFQPAYRDRKPVPVIVNIEVTFHLM